MLVRALYNLVDRTREQETFAPFILGPPIRLPPWARTVVSNISAQGRFESSSKVTTPKGIVQTGDVVFFGDTHKSRGKVSLLLRLVGVQASFWAVVEPFVAVPGRVGEWFSRTSDTAVASMDVVSGAMCFCIVGDRIYI